VSRRLDLELVARGLARSRSQAQALIRAGRVRVDGTVVRRTAAVVPSKAVVEADSDHYVSRGAHKLVGALDDLDLAVPARALDAGSSTGGFTQVLLERGATQVVAIDVGTGQLVEPLRSDPRVRLLEQTNLRDLTPAHVDGQPVDLVVADVSFISLTLLLRPLTAVTTPAGALLLLVKPQFEVGREDRLRHAAVAAVATAARELGWTEQATVPSRVVGESGNQEYFLLLRREVP
jgi:23S rRNA (cytidine1920-2'-O)/16S rRNA (cytidine1409-2'-O)-methyltransferase